MLGLILKNKAVFQRTNLEEVVVAVSEIQWKKCLILLHTRRHLEENHNQKKYETAEDKMALGGQMGSL